MLPSGVGCRNPEHLGQPGLAVSAMVDERLAGPLAGHQDPPTGVAEIFAPVGFALAAAPPQAQPGRRPSLAFLGWIPYRRSASAARTAA